MINSLKIVVQKHEGGCHVWYVHLNGRIILKCVLRSVSVERLVRTGDKFAVSFGFRNGNSTFHKERKMYFVPDLLRDSEVTAPWNVY